MKKKLKASKPTHQTNPLTRALVLLGVIILGVIIWYTIPRQSNLSINQIIEETGKVELRLDPETRTITPNSELSLNLQASTEASLIIGTQIELTYSTGCSTPTVVQGSHFTNVLSSPKIENGQINFTFVAPPDSGGITGHAISIATIKIKPSAVGVCELNFTENNLITIAGSNKNEVRSLTNARITIAAANPSTPASANPSSSPQKPNKPTGLRSNCFDNGSKITLRWDGVGGATSYKLRLDQKDGTDDKQSDNLTKTEHSYDLIPGQKYTWWVHASRDGLDSEEARITEVVCNKTVANNSTPTPTKAPTPKPTAKPTQKPTAKPTTKPTQAPPQLSPAPSSIANPEVAPGSLNDIFRDVEEAESQAQPSADLNFLQKIALGWQAIMGRLANLFQ